MSEPNRNKADHQGLQPSLKANKGSDKIKGGGLQNRGRGDKQDKREQREHNNLIKGVPSQGANQRRLHQLLR